MKKIYLFCSAGMSTSMLASQMQKVADEHNLPLSIKAFSHNKIEDIILNDRPDCILLGPQVQYLYEETVERFSHEDIPIAVINANDYGRMDSEKILKSTIKMMKTYKKGGQVQ